MKPIPLAAILVFSLVAITHLLRLILQVEVLVDGEVLPMWFSVLGSLIPGALAIGLWREARS